MSVESPYVSFRSLFALPFFLLMAMGPLVAQDMSRMRIGGGELNIIFDGSPSPALEMVALAWTRRAAQAVTVYYGEFPVPSVAIYLHVIDGSNVGSGRAEGNEGLRIDVQIGTDATADSIRARGDGWIMTHEMVHLALPSLERNHHWLEEGLATYVEPIARVRAGELSAARVWADMIEGMPQGQPKPGDQGLDRTPTWGRTYWGGAMFCLFADVKIREATHNRVGLETALRGVLRAHGSLAVDWPIERVLDTGDQALGVPVLRPLYEQMKFNPAPVDLAGLWRQLGVSDEGGRAVFDDQAPLAAIREAIMAP